MHAAILAIKKQTNNPPEELMVSILSPTEGQEVVGDLNITFELLNSTGLNILTPTEGEEIVGDLNITFEAI